jgi:hypothetical protein
MIPTRRLGMSHRALGSLIGLALLLSPGPAAAAEAWAFRFTAYGRTHSWHDDLAFHNTTDQEAAVTLLGVSNGELHRGDPHSMIVPRGRTVSLTDSGLWTIDSDSTLWVVHVDLPDGVLISSRGGIHLECPSPCGPSPNPVPTLGSFTMPVFRSLVSSGARQFHFGADLGGQQARSNVGIYNAGDGAATATISLYRACDDSLLVSSVVTVPANTALQVAIPEVVEDTACPSPALNFWLRYVTVVVDQPSLSYVFNILEPPLVQPARLPFGVAGS